MIYIDKNKWYFFIVTVRTKQYQIVDDISLLVNTLNVSPRYSHLFEKLTNPHHLLQRTPQYEQWILPNYRTDWLKFFYEGALLQQQLVHIPILHQYDILPMIIWWDVLEWWMPDPCIHHQKASYRHSEDDDSLKNQQVQKMHNLRQMEEVFFLNMFGIDTHPWRWFFF